MEIKTGFKGPKSWVNEIERLKARIKELEEQVKKPLSQFTRLELLAEIEYRMENE